MNIVDVLEQNDIDYRDSGKNVGADWIGIDCIQCGDTGKHLGINRSSLACSCFICGFKTHFNKLIYMIAGKYPIISSHMDNEKFSRPHKIVFNFDPLNEQHKEYLELRNYPSEIIEKLYGVRSAGMFGNFAYRLIIPYYYRKRLVTYIGRDTTEKLSIKYRNLSTAKSIYTAKEVLYNIDTVEDTAIIVEGVTDVWRVGKGCVALSGQQFSLKQIVLLRKVPRIFVMLDKDSKTKEDLAYSLSSFCRMVEIIDIDCSDPGEMPLEDVRHLRKTVFGKIY